MAETGVWVTRSDHHPCTEHASHWRLAAPWVDKTKIGYLRSCSERFPSAVSFTGTMDMALALRTMVVPTARTDTVYSYDGEKSRKEWVIHLQAGAGVVADSVPESEYEETVNKASALARAIDLAEQAFLP
mmetsp:Transcript_48773/g.156197  ORF Transcript_48773/g.156197 Transcript_48773/m.156197 type:complete len:130 (-) Transcript_48773:100-489(-)